MTSGRESENLAQSASFRKRPSTRVRLRSCSPARLEELDDGKDPAMIVSRRRQSQLAQDAPHVLLDGSLGNPQLLRYAVVRPPFGHQGEHLAFARGELRERICAIALRDQFLN